MYQMELRISQSNLVWSRFFKTALISFLYVYFLASDQKFAMTMVIYIILHYTYLKQVITTKLLVLKLLTSHTIIKKNLEFIVSIRIVCYNIYIVISYGIPSRIFLYHISLKISLLLNLKCYKISKYYP